MTCRIKEYKVTKCVHVRGADPFSKAIHYPEKERLGGGWAVQVWQQGCCVRPIEASAGGSGMLGEGWALVLVGVS